MSCCQQCSILRHFETQLIQSEIRDQSILYLCLRECASSFEHFQWTVLKVLNCNSPHNKIRGHYSSFNYYSMSAYLRSDYTQITKLSGAEERAAPAMGLPARFNALYSLGPKWPPSPSCCRISYILKTPRGFVRLLLKMLQHHLKQWRVHNNTSCSTLHKASFVMVQHRLYL